MTRLLRLASRLYHLALPLSHLLYALCALAPARAAVAQARPWNGPGVGLDSLQPAQAVVRIGVTVADMDRSLAFYTGVLQFAVVADTEVVGPEWEARTGVFGVRLRLVRLRLGTEELALTETMDMGKPITDSLKIDVPAAANCIAWYAEAVDKVYDEVAPTSHDSLALITREPSGVVGAIVPWNFPLLMAVWKIAPV